jgi:type II secretory pathway pseudopilin PulG
MIVLLIAALAAVALLAGGGSIARSRAREQQRRDRQHRARMAAAAAASRAEEERRRAALEASDALTSVLPAIRLPWPRQPQGPAPHDDLDSSLGDYPQFPAAVPFQAQEEPERTPSRAYPADRLAPAPPPSEPAPPAPPLAGRKSPADHPHRRPGHGTHRGGHARRRPG